MCAHLLSVTLLCDAFYYTRRYSSRDFTDHELGECVLDVVLQVLQTAFMAFSFVKVRVARHFVWPVGAALMRLPHWQQPRSLCPPPWLLCSPEICSICRGASVSAGQGQHGCRPSFALWQGSLFCEMAQLHHGRHAPQDVLLFLRCVLPFIPLFLCSPPG